MGVKDKVIGTISRYGMICENDNIIAGLSGGADSVCLTMILHELSREMGFALTAVHVNHCLRGEESDRDEEFCRGLCGRLGIPLTVYRVDVKGEVKKSGSSVEEAARELRYGAFREECEKFPSAKIATAHNKCDSSETVMFNIARGTGIKGICGIPYVRGNIIRPLLDCERGEIEAFLDEKGQEHVTDSSNLSDEYSRNRIRRQVIPQLTLINGGFHEAVSRLSLSAREDEEFFSFLLENISAEEIADQPAAVRKRYIAKILSENKIECSYERLCALDENIRLRKNTRYDLCGNVFAVFRNGTMTIEERQIRSAGNICIPVDFDEDTEILISEFDKIVKIKRAVHDNFYQSSIIHKNLTNNCVNYVKIQGVAVVRNKRDGDSMILKGRDFHTKLKKLYNAMKLSADERMTALVMEDDEGLIWSEYGGACDRVSPSAGDRPEDIFEITIVRR